MLRYLKTFSALLRQTQFSKHFEFSSNCVNKTLVLNEQKHFCTTNNDSIYSNVDYDAITKGSSELLQKLKVLMLEVEVLRQEGEKVPEKMTNERWEQILQAKSRSQRIKQLAFWWINEKKKEKDKEKKQLKRLAREESSKKITEDNGHITYGFGGSTIFLRMYETTIDRWKNWKLMEAMLFSQSLVIDCGYDAHMNNTELSNCAKQMVILFAENRSHRVPFNLYFCNAPRDNKLITKLEKLVPTINNPDFPINITEKQYTEVFPKEKLVYLTPHCREELKEYNEDDIYIIGAMVDKVNNEPLSLGKAKAEGLRTAKFPLDRYLDWNSGTKSLTINQALNVMLDLRVSGDWDKALIHVPKRKLRTEQESEAIDRGYKNNRRSTKRDEKPYRKHYQKEYSRFN